MRNNQINRSRLHRLSFLSLFTVDLKGIEEGCALACRALCSPESYGGIDISAKKDDLRAALNRPDCQVLLIAIKPADSDTALGAHLRFQISHAFGLQRFFKALDKTVHVTIKECLGLSLRFIKCRVQRRLYIVETINSRRA